MSIAPQRSYAGRPQPPRWTGEEFDRASAIGLFDRRRVELINGELLEEAPTNGPHARALRLTTYVLMRHFPADRATVSAQCPVRLGESRPFPDIAVLSGSPGQIVDHPTTAMLIVEVSDTSLQYDQGEKAELYAENLIPEYWIININAKSLEVRRKPSRSPGAVAQYADVKVYAATESISPLAAPTAVIQVSELLG